MKKIGLFLAEGLDEIEGLTVVDLLRRAEIEVVTISISEKKEVTGAHDITILADALFEEVAYEELDGIVLPGGMPGTTHLMEHAGVNQVIRQFAKEEKLVAAICAAPTVLGQAGLLGGKKATCYPGCEGKLTGAIYETDSVVCDGTIITSRGMGTAIPFGLAVVAYFKGQEVADQLAKTIIYA